MAFRHEILVTDLAGHEHPDAVMEIAFATRQFNRSHGVELGIRLRERRGVSRSVSEASLQVAQIALHNRSTGNFSSRRIVARE